MNKQKQQTLGYEPRPSGSGYGRFRRLIRVICSAVLFLAVLAPAAHAVEPKKPTAKKHFLWKVKSKTATVYLFGSIHAAKKELYPLDAVITDAFKKSDKVVFEIPMDPATQIEAGRKMIKAATYSADDSLNKQLDKETRKLLEAHLKKTKTPAGAYSRFRPWFVAIILTMNELQSAGYSAGQGVDQHFLQKAMAVKKPILALESIDDQVGMFRGLSDNVQQKMLKQTLEEVGKISKTLKKVFNAWKAGDGKTIDDLMLKPMRAAEYKPLYKKLFTERNRKMATKIEGYLKTKSTYFVVVGAGHLVGKDGLVEMLKAKKAYRVRQE